MNFLAASINWTLLHYTALTPDAEGEERFVAVGAGSAAHLLVVIYTLRGEAIRLISARRATPVEKRAYES
jgi:hypothetical protein